MQTANSAHVCTPNTPGEYIANLPAWDGVARLNNWLPRVVGSDGSLLTYTHQGMAGSVLLADMVRRAQNPGCSLQHTPLFIGPQGSGKRQLLRALAGPWLSDRSILDTNEPGEALGTSWLQPVAIDYIKPDQTDRFLKFARATRDVYRPSFATKAAPHPRHPIIAMDCDHAPEWTKQQGIYHITLHQHPADIEYLLDMRDMLFAEAKATYGLEG